MRKDDITDVPGIRVGHASDYEAITGCTVILCEEGAVAGVDIRGTASSTRQADPLSLLHIVNRVQGILLSGGSAFGLDATGGVMRYLEERGKGFLTRYLRIPIVPSAVIFDLSIGDPGVRPDPEMGYRACLEASEGPIPQGSVGAGTGATVGKLYGITRAMKGGLGSASVQGRDGLIVGALAVVNAFGDVLDPTTGELLAGLRDEEAGRELIPSAQEILKEGRIGIAPFENTTLGVVATNALLDRTGATRLAQMVQLALAKTISPPLSPFDGDVIFALSLGELKVDPQHVALLAQDALSRAIVKGIKEAWGMGGLPAWRDLHK